MQAVVKATLVLAGSLMNGKTWFERRHGLLSVTKFVLAPSHVIDLGRHRTYDSERPRF